MNLEHRVAMLEQTNRRYRWCMIGLAALLLLTVGVGAVQVGEDGQLVLKRLVIEDDEGRERIVLGTLATGQASLTHFDRNGKRRIAAVTLPSGQAIIGHYDANEKMQANTACARWTCTPMDSAWQRSIPMVTCASAVWPRRRDEGRICYYTLYYPL